MGSITLEWLLQPLQPERVSGAAAKHTFVLIPPLRGVVVLHGIPVAPNGFRMLLQLNGVRLPILF